MERMDAWMGGWMDKYIYIYKHVHIYLYIYIYVELDVYLNK